MKALSIRQPWAWAIIHARKDIENRKWNTKYRGSFFVHAAKKFDRQGYDWLLQNKELLHIASLPQPTEFRSGGLIGTVNIIDCVEDHGSNWFFGPYGFLLEDPKPIDFIPYKGQLGFFSIK